MKIPLLLASLIVLCANLLAQAPAALGVKLGMNLSQHYGTKSDEGDYEVSTGLRPGFIGGVYLDFAAGDNLELGFEALYAMKGSQEKIKITRMELDNQMQELERPATMKVKYHLDYLELPVLLKLKVVKLENIHLSAIAGTAVGIKLHGNHNLEGKVYLPDSDGGFSEILISEHSNLSDVNMFDFSFVYGGGLDFCLFYPMSIEYRFTLGWDYLYLPTYELFEPVALRNQSWAVLLSTTF